MIKLKHILQEIESSSMVKNLEKEMTEYLTSLLQNMPKYSGYSGEVHYHSGEKHGSCPLGFDLVSDKFTKKVKLDVYDPGEDGDYDEYDDDEYDDCDWEPEYSNIEINSRQWWDAVEDELKSL